jgi:hypothetical protein
MGILTCLATLFDPATNRRTVVTETYAQDDEVTEGGADYMWTEGNWSCDCNKRLFIARALGEPEPETTDPCGDTIKLEKLEFKREATGGGILTPPPAVYSPDGEEESPGPVPPEPDPARRA